MKDNPNLSSVGLLLVTHNNLGSTLLKTVIRMFGACPLRCRVLRVSERCELESLKHRARQEIADLDRGDGVLVFTDIYGSTPANVATSLYQEGRVAVVAGLNMPMLVRVFNSPCLELSELKKRALSGGRDGVIECQPSTDLQTAAPIYT